MKVILYNKEVLPLLQYLSPALTQLEQDEGVFVKFGQSYFPETADVGARVTELTINLPYVTDSGWAHPTLMGCLDKIDDESFTVEVPNHVRMEDFAQNEHVFECWTCNKASDVQFISRIPNHPDNVLYECETCAQDKYGQTALNAFCVYIHLQNRIAPQDRVEFLQALEWVNENYLWMHSVLGDRLTQYFTTHRDDIIHMLKLSSYTSPTRRIKEYNDNKRVFHQAVEQLRRMHRYDDEFAMNTVFVTRIIDLVEDFVPVLKEHHDAVRALV